MLKHMPDSQKFRVTQILCQDVLSAAVEGILSLTDLTACSVLVDSLKVLQSKVRRRCV
mgnify:CR=1 FL=1